MHCCRGIVDNSNSRSSWHSLDRKSLDSPRCYSLVEGNLGDAEQIVKLRLTKKQAPSSMKLSGCCRSEFAWRPLVNGQTAHQRWDQFVCVSCCTAVLEMRTQILACFSQQGMPCYSQEGQNDVMKALHAVRT